MSLIKILDFHPLGDNRGSLISIEEKETIPFEIKRMYYIFDTQNGVSRGFHAHLNLKQLVICVSGSCKFILDNGKNKEEVLLNNPNQGLLIENLTWREMHEFSNNCILVVLANNHYDENDYIRDYNEFLKLTSNDL